MIDASGCVVWCYVKQFLIPDLYFVDCEDRGGLCVSLIFGGVRVREREDG
jgi:hypothetical protein